MANTASELILETDGCIFYSALSYGSINPFGAAQLKNRGTPLYILIDTQFNKTLDRGIGTGYDYLYLDESNTIGTKCCEMYFSPTVSTDYTGIISVNCVKDVSRSLLLISNYLSGAKLMWYVSDSGKANIESTIHTRSSLLGKTHHVLVQFDSSLNETHVYVDGIKDNSLTLGYDIFNSGTRGVMTLCGFPNLNDSVPYGGGCLGSQFALYDRILTMVEIKDRADLRISLSTAVNIKPLNIINQTWANKETRAQANPYHANMQHLDHKDDIRSLNKQGVYSLTPMLDKNPRGYFQSTVTISGVPTANRRVICFTNGGQKIAETRSNAQGVYRFDHLQMNEKYMFVAQYDNATETSPEYLATASDWQSPTAY